MARFSPAQFTDQSAGGIIRWIRTVLAPGLTGNLSFGTLTVGGVFNGDNIRGTMQDVTVALANLGAQTTVTHSLNVPIVSATFPNVAWLLLGVRTVGNFVTTVGATSSATVWYDAGTITVNSIQLKFSSSLNTAGGSLTFRLFILPTAG